MSFLFNDTATTEIYTLSLHDALPIYGLMRGQQRYLCKDCGLNFTNTPSRGKPLALKAAAVLLYVSGLSMNRTAKLLGVSTPTIQAWLEQFAQTYAHKPEPEGRAEIGRASCRERV